MDAIDCATQVSSRHAAQFLAESWHFHMNQGLRAVALFQALEKYNVEKDIAAFIKKEFDKKYNPTWHCIVGRNFGQ